MKKRIKTKVFPTFWTWYTTIREKNQLNGINVVSKKKEEGYIFKSGKDFYVNLIKWGYYCIRFIIIWDRLEHESGVYNEEYLKEIDFGLF